MIDKYEIIIVGYRWHWETLERTIDSIIRTNRHKWKINVGLNAPESEMLAMIEKRRPQLNLLITADRNLNKVGMQQRLVHSSSAKYIVSFDHDSYVIAPDWQDLLIRRIHLYENKLLPFFGGFDDKSEEAFRRMTDNAIGILGLIFYEGLDDAKRQILSRCPWYDPINKLNHERWSLEKKREQFWFCAGSFYVFLRQPYVEFDYPGFDYKMAHEDMILSYFFQHHGYRIGDLGAGFPDSGLDCAGKCNALGNRVVLNDGERTFDIKTVETVEHSLSRRAADRYYGNPYLTEPSSVQSRDVFRRFRARHSGWSGQVILYSDGSFQGGLHKPNGNWRITGPSLTLTWHHWPETRLKSSGIGSYFSENAEDDLELHSFDISESELKLTNDLCLQAKLTDEPSEEDLAILRWPTMRYADFLPSHPNHAKRREMWNYFLLAEFEAKKLAKTQECWRPLCAISLATHCPRWLSDGTIELDAVSDWGPMFHEIFHSTFSGSAFASGDDIGWSEGFCDTFRYMMEKKLVGEPFSDWFSHLDRLTERTFAEIISDSRDKQYDRMYSYPASRIISKADKDPKKFYALWGELQRLAANKANFLTSYFRYNIREGRPI